MASNLHKRFWLCTRIDNDLNVYDGPWHTKAEMLSSDSYKDVQIMEREETVSGVFYLAIDGDKTPYFREL